MSCSLISILLFVGLLLSSEGSETLVYKRAGSMPLKLYVEKPADWKASDKRPAIVFFFGGGWVGERSLSSNAKAPIWRRGAWWVCGWNTESFRKAIAARR